MKNLQLLALSMLLSTPLMILPAADAVNKAKDAAASAGVSSASVEKVVQKVRAAESKIQEHLKAVQDILEEGLKSIKDQMKSSNVPAAAQAKLKAAQDKLQAASSKVKEAVQNGKDAVEKAIQALPANVQAEIASAPAQAKKAANQVAKQGQDALKKFGIAKGKKSGDADDKAPVDVAAANDQMVKTQGAAKETIFA